MRITLAPAFLFAALVFCACAGSSAQAPSRNGGGATSGKITPAPSSVANDVVRHTNDARARNGLPPLASSPKLMEAARIQALQMAQYQRLDHKISQARYPTLETRLQAVSYDYSSTAENVAWNQRDAVGAVNSWMRSAGHRANILDPSQREIGAAMARSAKGEPYWVQVFGTPR